MQLRALRLVPTFIAALFISTAAAGPARADDDLGGDARAFFRFAPGFGYGFDPNDFNGKATDASFAFGVITPGGFALHLTAAGSVLFGDWEDDRYYYGVGLGGTYFPGTFFVSTSVIYGERQYSDSSRGTNGPGAELLVGGAWGDGSTKLGVAGGVIGYMIKPYATREYGFSPTVRFIVTIK